MSKLISSRYAKALFEIAKESGKIDIFESQLNAITTALNDEEFLGVFNHPQVTSSEKFNILKNTFEGKVEQEIIALFDIIIKKNRESEIINIFSEVLSMINEYKGITTAFIYSAKMMTASQVSDIKEKLSKKLNKQVRTKTYISEELVAGVKIIVDDIIIDTTFKKRIADIKKGLMDNKLA